MKKEYHISECCKAPLFFKGEGKGLWCSNCKKEVTETIVAIGEKEIKELKIFSKLSYDDRTLMANTAGTIDFGHPIDLNKK